MKSYHSLFVISLLAFDSLVSAQDIHLQNGNKIITIKTGTFISLQLSVVGQKPCLDCDLNYFAGQLISYVNGKVKLRLVHADEVILDDKNKVGYYHRNFEEIEDQPIMEIAKDSILSLTKRGSKHLNIYSTGENIGRFLAILGAANILSAPIGATLEKGGAEPFIFFGLTEFVSGGLLGAAFRRNTLITSPDFPQKRNHRKIWVLN